MTRGTRTRVAKGIYSDQYGLSGIVTVGRVNREQRWPADADHDEIRAWQDQARGELLLEKPTRGAITRRQDPFENAVARYLKLLVGRPGYRADTSHLAAWVAEFKDRPRAAITSEDVRLAFATWRTGGQRRRHQTIARPVSPQTLRHRYRVLKKLYRVLDGTTAKTPLDDVPRPTVPRSQPRDVDIARIKSVVTKLADKDPITHARFVVLATTGKAPAEVMRAEPGDVQLRQHLWVVKPAKSRMPQTLHLNGAPRRPPRDRAGEATRSECQASAKHS